MASWTDAIPKFNPYIQQLPVEAMVAVGMDKQRRYEEGVQRIQAQIDQVAGMDIYKDADKKYLQSKLDELGNNLKGVAAGDFSNFQLVNSVGGMVGQISKDPIVTNAVVSTQQIKKQLANMEEDRKKGILHANNESVFNEQLQNYVRNNKVGEVFNAKYYSYTDYQKKWRDIQKELGVKEIQTDLPYVMKDGQVVFGKDGKPLVNDYMVRETFKGIDPQRLKEAIMTSLDDNDYRQMQIDAHVSYRGYTPEMLIQDAESRYSNEREQLEKTITSLNILKNQYAGDKEMTDKINAQINSYTTKLKSEDDEFESVVEGIRANPEAYKSKLFNMNVINSFANTFSNMSHIQNVISNPIKQQQNEDRNYNFKVIEFDTKNKQWEKEFGLKTATETRLANKESFDRSIELYKLGLGPNPLGGAGAPKYIGAPSTDPEVLDGMIESFKQGADINRLNEDRNQLKVNWAKNQPTKADLEEQLGKKMSNDDYKKFLDNQFNNDLVAYNKDRNSIKSPAARKIFDQYSELDKLYKLKVNAVTAAMKEADELNPEAAVQIDKLGKNKVNFLKSGMQNGKVGLYPIMSKSAREIYDDVKSGKAKLTIEKGTEGEADDFILSYPSQKIQYSIPKTSGWFGMDVPGAKESRPVLQSVYDALQTTPSIKKRDADYARILGQKINALAPASSNLPKGSANTLLPLIQEKLEREQKGQTEEIAGFVKGKDFSIDKVKALAISDDVKPTYTTWGDNVYITLTGTVDKTLTTQKFKISRDEFNRSFPALAETSNVDFLQSAAANGSTNYNYSIANSALNNPNKAFSSANYNIPSSKYIVKGDIFFDQNDKNSTTPIIWVKSKKTGKVLPIQSSEYSTFLGADKAMGQINDLTIENYLKNNNLDADF